MNSLFSKLLLVLRERWIKLNAGARMVIKSILAYFLASYISLFIDGLLGPFVPFRVFGVELLPIFAFFFAFLLVYFIASRVELLVFLGVSTESSNWHFWLTGPLRILIGLIILTVGFGAIMLVGFCADSPDSLATCPYIFGGLGVVVMLIGFVVIRGRIF